ncbi:MAG: 4-hydroxybenzoyl-CoA reductase subunit beta [Planctomycetota bacterium]|jgi:xanthine dehydrogenase YagS FAD-binding subunit
MKNFEYAAPTTESEALQLLGDSSVSTEILAGGTDLVGLMKKMIVTPDRVVNILGIPSLRTLERRVDGQLWIGAAVTLDTLLDSPYLAGYDAVTQAIRGINSMQFQCQGTIGGEICQRPQCWFFRGGRGLLGEGGQAAANGDNRYHAIFGNDGPAKFVHSSRIAPALIALGAAVRVIGGAAGRGPDGADGEVGERLVPIAEFFQTPRHERQRETILAPNQLVTHIVLPSPAGIANATYEVRHGEGPDYPLAAASAALRMDGERVADARIVMGQVAPTPWNTVAAAALLRGRSIDETVAEAAGQAAVADATPLSQNAYKVQLAKVAVKRAILAAAGHPTGGF